MIRAGILSFSDGRPRVHETLKEYISSCETSLKSVLEENGVEVVTMNEIIASNAQARSVSLRMAKEQVDACLFNVPVFAFPNFSVIAQRMLSCPVMITSPRNGAFPGLGGMQAAANSIRQTGTQCEKLWASPDDPQAISATLSFLRAAHASAEMKGSVYGLIGGRSIGMGCGVIHPDRWMQLFGIDVEHIDESEILRLADEADEAEVERGMEWLRDNMKEIAYDNDKLTTYTLDRQVRAYLAIKELIRRHGLSFVGAKCHYDMSEFHYGLCLAAALCNDPYDWNGSKEPVVFSCEADNDAALTMQVLHLLTDKPVLFLDFRHYLEEEGLFVFCNCGSCATWYSQCSENACDNLGKVTLCPLIQKYNGTGCHVRFMAKAGEMTFARFTKVMDEYRLQAFTGQFEEVPEEYMNKTCSAWPHGFARINGDPYKLISRYESNHIHAVSGNCMAELEAFCRLKGIAFEAL